jgi:hypothetical protein
MTLPSKSLFPPAGQPSPPCEENSPQEECSQTNNGRRVLGGSGRRRPPDVGGGSVWDVGSVGLTLSFHVVCVGFFVLLVFCGEQWHQNVNNMNGGVCRSFSRSN